MNDYVNKNGGDEGIFLVTQYFINSYLDPKFYPDFNNELSTIKEGNSYEYYWEEEWVDKKRETGMWVHCILMAESIVCQLAIMIGCKSTSWQCRSFVER